MCNTKMSQTGYLVGMLKEDWKSKGKLRDCSKKPRDMRACVRYGRWNWGSQGPFQSSNSMQCGLESITEFYGCKGQGDHLIQLFHCRKWTPGRGGGFLTSPNSQLMKELRTGQKTLKSTIYQTWSSEWPFVLPYNPNFIKSFFSANILSTKIGFREVSCLSKGNEHRI